MWAHVGNNFVLDFHEDDLADVQARQETTTGLWGRSYQASMFLRPTNSLDVVSTYFMPATAGGDHSLKFGYRWRTAHSTSLNHRGGFIDARFTNGVANSADIWRDQYSESHLNTNAFYAQDTFTRNRLTINLGFRLDIQDDAAQAGRVPENPFFPQLMPAIDFQGADAGVVWKDLSPRLGATYDLKGDGKTIISSSYAIYYGQMAPGQVSGQPRRDRRRIRPLPVDRHQRRPVRAAERGQHDGAVPEQEQRLRSGEPGQHHLADHR